MGRPNSRVGDGDAWRGIAMTESWDFLLLFLAGGAIGAVLGALFERQRPSARHLAEIEQLQSRVLALNAESAALPARSC